MSVKLKHNISSWDRLKLNYWGIPKCGNTSVKYALAAASELKLQALDDICVWVHKESLTQYITPQQAIENGFRNFTVIRNPLDRFMSMHKDICRREPLSKIVGNDKSINNFLNYLEKTNDDKRNVHFRSQCYFIAQGDKVIPDILSYADIEQMLNTKIEHLNSIEKQYDITDEQKNRVYNIFQKDYELLGF